MTMPRCNAEYQKGFMERSLLAKVMNQVLRGLEYWGPEWRGEAGEER